MSNVKTILIRLPNWLGDMVMATAFVKAVNREYPTATVDLIAKKGVDFLLDYFPAHGKRFIFSKEKYRGWKGARKFGKEIRKEKKYDLFFCLPDSFSSAAMGNTIKAKKSIGFKKSIHFILFTNVYRRAKNLHRVEEYTNLLEQFLKKKIDATEVSLSAPPSQKNESLVININSEASSRRLPKEKAITIIDMIRKRVTNHIILTGSPGEKQFVDEVYNCLSDKKNITNLAGKTTLPELVNLFSSCKLVLSADSGPAHVSNALGIKTVVLFGAGDENNTAPYNKVNRTIIRLGKLPCEPCTNNICKIYGTPECLLQLDENLIAEILVSQSAE